VKNIEKALKIAIVLTFMFFIVEIIGGYVSGSLSLLGDAGHMLRDVFALIISLSAIRISEKLPTKSKTFGYHRVEIFSAFLNGLMLIVISIWIFWEAYNRINDPQEIESVSMLTIAIIGLLVNVFVASKLHGSHDLNVRGAFLHVLSDTLSSVAVIIAALWIYFTGQLLVDPILGVGSAFGIIRDSVHILLEYTPKNVDFDAVIKDLESIEGVESLHSVHIWTLCSNVNVMNAHVYTTQKNMARIEAIKREIKKRLLNHNVSRSTLEFECEECDEAMTCVENGKIGKVCH